MKLLLLLWWGSAAAAANYCAPSSITMGTEDQSGMDVDNSCQIMAASDDEGGGRVPKKSSKPGPKPSSNDTDGGMCFLCDLPGATIKFGPRNCTHLIHSGACNSAKRCHDRMVSSLCSESSSARDKDRALLAKDPTAYKELLAPLLMVGNATRSQDVLSQHKDKLTKVFFQESYVDKARELATKTRFKSFMRREEDYTDGEASSSFERRLEEQSSDNNASDGGGPQVSIRKNPVIGIKTGSTVTQADVSVKRHDSGRNRDGNRRRDAKDDGRGRASSRGHGHGDRRRGRSRASGDVSGRRSRSSNRRRERQDRTPTPPIVKSEPGTPAARANASASNQSSTGTRRRMTAKGGPEKRASRGASGKDDGGDDGSLQIVEVPPKEQNDGVAFLKDWKAFKKNMEKRCQKTDQKS